MDAMSISLLRLGALSATVCVLALAACSSKPVARAPVEDRGRVAQNAPAASPAPAPVADASKAAPTPALDPNAGKPGYYTVKQGDTLIRIGLESGQSHRDIARWNALENPNRIEIGQVLRVVPPEDAVVTKPVAVAKATSTALPPASAASAPTKAASAPASASSNNNSSTEDDISFAWPSKGEVIDGFDEAKNRKGVDLGGASGDAVWAAADGKVVYADSGLRGYGKLIILKHNSMYLTAYAHNQTLLVKEDQMVKKGQKIAEMGSTDADRVKLHFEVRKQGKPVDPTKYLPAR
jgi:lipoprotein NlpD